MVSYWNFLDQLKRVQDLEAMYKDSKHPSHGVIKEFAKLNNLDGATVKVWFNNKRQRDTGETSLSLIHI